MFHPISTAFDTIRQAALVTIALFCLSGHLNAETRVETFFDNTDHKLTVYYISGKEPGTTMLIIGGIQGDEPGGYIAADLYADILLEKGNLIVVPRANFFSIKMNSRGVNGDMNRKFASGTSPKGDYDYNIVEVLKELMAKSDVLLNLHEGSGYFNPEYVSDVKNPMRYGQSIIIDSYTYIKSSGDTLDIRGPAERVISEINANIKNTDHHYHLNNHDTFSGDSRHKEQRGSATFNALSLFEIPAYGIEASKEITSIETKVKYETLAINAFMREYGIIPEHPSIYLPKPELDHLVITSAENPNPFAVKNGATLSIPRGSEIEVSSIVANYSRGLTIDIIGYGNGNDINRHVVITAPTKIGVYKDAYKCGEVNIDIVDNVHPGVVPHVHNDMLENVKIRVNDKNIVVSSADTLHIVRGDIVRLIEARTVDPTDRNIRLNFKGFVGNKDFNDAEDRGYDINTSVDLIERFSLRGRDSLYQIEAIRDQDIIGYVYIALDEPVIRYIIIEDDTKQKLALCPGDVLHCKKTSTVKILSIVSNVTSQPDIVAYIRKSSGIQVPVEVPSILDLSETSTVFFTRANLDLGSISFPVDGKT